VKRISTLVIFLALATVSAWAARPTTQVRDRYISVTTNDPAIAGQQVRIYVRERATPEVLKAGAGDKVVLFVHGAGTPAEVSFDVPYRDYSWMGYLANAGYDVFAVDMLGYGRSSRPPQMADKCNLADKQQQEFDVHCAPSYPGALTNIESDWQDVTAAVNYIRHLRHVEKVNLIGWSQGGPRAGGWAALHSEQVARLVLLAPAYNRAVVSADAPSLPVPGPVFNTQSRTEFISNWDRQAPCQGQYDPATAQAIWSELLASDPVGSHWQPAVRRAPISSSSWGWTTDRVKAMSTPTLMVSGDNDKQVDPQHVRDFYADLGSSQKVFVSLACSSHNAMWEKNHLTLFKASLEWLEHGTVNGRRNGTQKLGD
jgi:pimeloyl-ACP methyl ester carboxylesterase